MEKIREKALRLGATDFNKSSVAGKRFYVKNNGKKINFGSDVGQTFIDHGDVRKRKAWKARHSVIRTKAGAFAITLKTQPSYWSYHLLW